MSKDELLEIAKKNFENWNKAILTRDPTKVAELYHENNLFLPTLSPDFKKGMGGIQSYFLHFLAKNPDGKIIEDDVFELSPNSFLHTGFYDFLLGDIEKVQARFTFVYIKNENGKWKIIHHHSSLKPE